jgi:DNA-binding beta-propeller fold protein YncE
MRIALARALVLTALVLPVGGQAAVPPYEVAARIAAGGEGGWDLLTVEPDAHHLFVARSTRVQVIDLERDSLVGEIADTPGVHGVALVPEFGRGFTSNGRDSSVTVFDLRTLAVIARVKVPGRNPDAIVYDPASMRVFAFNGGSASATAIDAATHQVVGTVPLDGKPELAVADGRGRMYVNLEDSSAVACFDTHTLQVLARWPLAPGEGPTGLAMDREHRRLFAGCGNRRLVVLDADSGRRVADLPIGGGVDGVAFDPWLRRVLTSNGEGTLTVIQVDTPDHYVPLGDVPTQRGARTLALDEISHRVYTATAQFGETPPATPERPHPRPALVPGTFEILVLELPKQGTPRK